MTASGSSARVRVLLVMGNALANLVAVTLRHARYDTEICADETSLRQRLRGAAPDLVLIDLDHHDAALDLVRSTLPEMPLIGLTRSRSPATKLRTFERGADDAIQVPFTLDEIIARPYALLRRVGITTALAPRIRISPELEVDLLAQTVRFDGGRALELTPIQQTLLYILAANAGQVLTRETLLATIWGNELQIESNVVDRHIRELRVKLADDWRSAKYIETIAGRGYRFKTTTRTADQLAVDVAAQ